MPARPCRSQHGQTGHMLDQLLADLSQLLRDTSRVRVFDERSLAPAARKRRDRAPALADVHGSDMLAELRTALAVQPEADVMYWMCALELRLELFGGDTKIWVRS
jgi:hypothetical protein